MDDVGFFPPVDGGDDVFVHYPILLRQEVGEGEEVIAFFVVRVFFDLVKDIARNHGVDEFFLFRRRFDVGADEVEGRLAISATRVVHRDIGTFLEEAFHGGNVIATGKAAIRFLQSRARIILQCVRIEVHFFLDGVDVAGDVQGQRHDAVDKAWHRFFIGHRIDGLA